jgi:uncharacterized protein
MPLGTLSRYVYGHNRGLLNLTQRPKVYHVTVPVKDLPEALDGVSICQLSDFHRSDIVPERHIRACAEAGLKLKCDVVALTGDFVSNSGKHYKSLADGLACLEAPLGKYAVWGNHDYWSGKLEALQAELESTGVQVLTNRAVAVETKGTRWWVVGVDDMWTGKPDLDKALEGVPDDEFRLLLSHCPDFADIAAQRGIQLQLSGHSHGGQVAGFFMTHRFLPKYGRKYPIGLQHVASSNTIVYTNVGIGAVTVPVRVGRRPEVTHLILKKA